MRQGAQRLVVVHAGEAHHGHRVGAQPQGVLDGETLVEGHGAVEVRPGAVHAEDEAQGADLLGVGGRDAHGGQHGVGATGPELLDELAGVGGLGQDVHVRAVVHGHDERAAVFTEDVLHPAGLGDVVLHL